MGNLVMMRAGDCGPDVRGLFTKIEQTSLAYYEFEQIDTATEAPTASVSREAGLLRSWRSPEAEPAACAYARLDALFARLSAQSGA